MPWYLITAIVAAAFVLGIIVGGYCATWFAAAWSESELFHIERRPTKLSVGLDAPTGKEMRHEEN